MVHEWIQTIFSLIPIKNVLFFRIAPIPYHLSTDRTAVQFQFSSQIHELWIIILSMLSNYKVLNNHYSHFKFISFDFPLCDCFDYFQKWNGNQSNILNCAQSGRKLLTNLWMKNWSQIKCFRFIWNILYSQLILFFSLFLFEFLPPTFQNFHSNEMKHLKPYKF